MSTAELSPKRILLIPAFDMNTMNEGGMTKDQRNVVQSKIYSGLTEVFSPSDLSPAHITARIFSRHIGLAMKSADLESKRHDETIEQFNNRLSNVIASVEYSWMKNAAVVAPQDVIDGIGKLVGIAHENAPLVPGKIYEVVRHRNTTL